MRKSIRFLVGVSLSFFLTAFLIPPSLLAQNLGDYYTAGYSNARTGANAQMGDFRPPLKLVRTIPLSGIDGYGVKFGLHLDVPNMPGDAFRLIGFYSNNANAYSVGSRWSVLAAYNHVFSPTLSGAIGFQYMADTNFAAVGTPDAYTFEAAVVWSPVTNFEVRLEGSHTRANLEIGYW